MIFCPDSSISIDIRGWFCVDIGLKKDQDLLRTNEGCCGGPAPDDVAACCVEDAETKATGEDGGGTAPVQSNVPPSAYCVTHSQTSEDVSSNDKVRQAVRQQYRRVTVADAGCGSGCCDVPLANVVSVWDWDAEIRRLSLI